MTSGGNVVELPVEDYIAIQQLYIRYAYLVDMHDRDELVETCWTEDGEYITFRPGGQPRSKGRAAIKAQAKTALVPHELGYHWNTNPLIEATEYGARGRCYLLYILANEDGTFGEIRYALYYRDELVKQHGRWLFRRRNTTTLPEGRIA
jgi:hypothetical protein